MKPTAKLSGFVTLGVTLCASWTQAASTTVAPTTMIGPTMVGQAPARSATRTQSDDLLRRARQAIREGKYDLANKLISQAEELKVTYDPVFSRFSDTPAKLRKELDAARAANGGEAVAGPVPGLLENGAGRKSNSPAGRRAADDEEMSDVAVPPSAGGSDDGSGDVFALLGDARRALARGEMEMAERLVAQVRQMGGTYAVNEDSPDRVEALIRQWNQYSQDPRPGVDAGQWAKQKAQNLMEQAEWLKRYGEMDVANQLLNTARQQAASYGPFDRNPQKMLGNMRANAESAVEREVAGIAGAANRVVDRTANRVNGTVNKVQGAVREEASDVADAMREVQSLMAKAQAAKDRGELELALRLVNEAKSFRLPDEAFRSGETRPWQVALEIDSELARRGGVARANAEAPESDARPGRFGVTQGGYDPGQDTSRVIQANAASPSRAQLSDEGAVVTQGQQLYREGIELLQQQDREGALRAFREAWKFQAELDPDTRRQLREKLTVLSESVPAAAPAGREPSALESIASRQQILRQKLLSEIASERDAARATASEDPRAALSRLQRLRERVTQSEVDPAGRKQLLTMVDREISELDVYIEQHRGEIENNERNREILTDVERRRRVKVEMQTKFAELVDQFNDLMDEARYAEAVVLARQAQELDPENPVVENLSWKARFAMRLAEQKRIDDAKEEGFHKEMNENLHIAATPMDTNNPISFNIKDWDEISRKRLQWQQRLRKRFSPTELEIQRSLSQMVDVQFDNMPLKEVVSALEKQSGINIFLDPSGMAIEGVTSDTPVSLTLARPISLRSALNLILEPKRLGYVIQNEVLKITSSQTKDSDVYTQVYDVADLVIPIPNFVPGYNTGLPSAIEQAQRSMGLGGGLQAGGGAPMQLTGNQSQNMNPAVMAQIGGGIAPGSATRPSHQVGAGPGGL
ncbi:MAG: hypothetical protein RIS70_2282, partial [Planctomycetota bacterium]